MVDKVLIVGCAENRQSVEDKKTSLLIRNLISRLFCMAIRRQFWLFRAQKLLIINFAFFSFCRFVVFSPRYNGKTINCKWHKAVTIYNLI
jgi:hypothetical protein